MEKLFIKNRKGQKIAVVVETPQGEPKGLVFVMHGLGGFKEQLHVRAVAEAFIENSYTTVTFDTTNSVGESDGLYQDATTTNYFQDLEDLIVWAQKQVWYSEPFILAGHSLGGISVILYTQKNPKKLKALAPISTVVSGKLSLETQPHKELDQWKTTGWQERPSVSKPGTTKRLKWSHMEDMAKYDVMPKVDLLTMPVLMVVGDVDDRTPVKHQQILFDKLPGRKELHIVPGGPHTFMNQEHLTQLKQIFDSWIKSLN